MSMSRSQVQPVANLLGLQSLDHDPGEEEEGQTEEAELDAAEEIKLRHRPPTTTHHQI
jgi:hypothetical protein